MSNNEYSVEILSLAEEDLENIYTYYFEESKEEEVAKILISELKNAILGLSFMPKSHPQARELRLCKKGFRKLVCGKYVIPFLIDEKRKAVLIVRVFHGKMSYQKLL